MKYQVISSSWFKNFILNLDFVHRELNGAYKRGGVDSFPLAQKDVLETLRDDTEKMADERVHQKLVEMLSPVDWSHVITHDTRKGVVFIGGKQADPAFLQSLKSEAEMVTSTELWRLLIETPNTLAQQIMFKTGEDTQAFQKGRSMIYHLDSQKKIVETLMSYKQPPKPEGPPGAYTPGR